jgi:magnesium-transporting ATPase (P-type)
MRVELSSEDAGRRGHRYRFKPWISWAFGALFVAAFAFAVMAILRRDYLSHGRDLTTQENATIVICSLAAAVTALVCWWLQTYAAARHWIVRAFYGLAMLIIVFGAVGGVLVIIHNYIVYSPEIKGGGELLFKGYYWESLAGFYTFALFLFSPIRPGLLLLFVAGGLCLAFAGPQIAKGPPRSR